MKLLIKLGGTLLDDQESRHQIARQLTEVARRHQTVVVHGGGKQVTRYLQERNVQSEFVGGLRVSGPPVIEAVTNVIAGSVNKQLVASLIAAGAKAVGLSGVDGLLTVAQQLRPELGLVGRPVQTSPQLLDLLLSNDYLPAIACIAGDTTGAIYNVNADSMAVSCAIGWQADALLFLTDVPGVKGQSGQVITKLTTVDIQALIDSGVAHGGMQAKLEAAQAALESGVKTIYIAPGQERNICLRLLDGEQLGTSLRSTASEGAAF